MIVASNLYNGVHGKFCFFNREELAVQVNKHSRALTFKAHPLLHLIQYQIITYKSPTNNRNAYVGVDIVYATCAAFKPKVEVSGYHRQRHNSLLTQLNFTFFGSRCRCSPGCVLTICLVFVVTHSLSTSLSSLYNKPRLLYKYLSDLI